MSSDHLQQVLSFTPCGLVLDASGVVLLGFAFFLKNTESMIQESGTTWDSTAYVAVASAKCDGIFGTTLLFIGFIYQAIGYVGIYCPIVTAVTYVALATFLILYVTWLRSSLTDRWVSQIERKLTPEGTGS